MAKQGQVKQNHVHRRWLRRLVWLLASAVGVVLIALAMRPQPVPVDLASAQRGPLEVTVDEEGETRVRERYVVSAPLAGRVLRIELEPGDPVVAEETILAIFQPAEPVLLDARSRAEAAARVQAMRAAVSRAQAERDGAAAELEYRQAELRRFQRLAAEGVVSGEALDAAQIGARTAEESLKAAESALRNTRYELEVARAALIEDGPGTAGRTLELRSPVDGAVLKRLRESEAIVAAGEPLLEVGDPRQLEIIADFLSTDAVKIRPGQAVYVEQWGGEGSLAGRVRRVEPSGFMKVSALGVEEQRVNVILDLVEPAERWQALGDGYRVEVRVLVWQADDALKVPTSSLFRDGDAWAVLTVQAGQARKVRLELGQHNGREAEVRSGLTAGQEVVIHPGDRVADGIKVTAREE